MKTPNQETKPRLFKAGTKLTAVAVADPSFTLIEVGDSVGFLLAESGYESMMGTKLHLEEVLWVRYAKKTGLKGRIMGHKDLGLRPFEQVDLYRHSVGIFVVQDVRSQYYLPYPSNDPYAVVFLSKDQYDQIRQEITERAIEEVLTSIGSVVEDVPDVSFDGVSITASASYANVTAPNLEHGLIEV